MSKVRAILDFLTSGRFFTVIFLLVTLLGIPFTVALIKQQQDLRKRAQTSCIIEFPMSAKNPTTGECREFPTPCDVPQQWEYTPSCNPTKVTLYLKIPGIGTDGNRNPRNSSRTMQVFLFNSQNQEIKRASSTANFDGVYFKGEGNLGNDLRLGVYFIKVKLDNTLAKFVRENATILAGGSFSAPATTLISGDINNDNSLDILDYNIFISCYGNKTCTHKQNSDFDDNGTIEGIDYNILIRGFRTMLFEPPDVLPPDLTPYLFNITVNINVEGLFPTIPPGL